MTSSPGTGSSHGTYQVSYCGEPGKMCMCSKWGTKKRNHTQLLPREPDPNGRAVNFEFTADTFDSDTDREEDEYTAERILLDNPDPSTPGGWLYQVRWKGSAAPEDSWEPPSSFVPRYTSMWLHHLKAQKIKLDVKDVLVHLVMGDRD